MSIEVHEDRIEAAPPGTLLEHLTAIAEDLDTALWKIHRDLTGAELAGFWQSDEVRQHLLDQANALQSIWLVGPGVCAQNIEELREGVIAAYLASITAGPDFDPNEPFKGETFREFLGVLRVSNTVRPMTNLDFFERRFRDALMGNNLQRTLLPTKLRFDLIERFANRLAGHQMRKSFSGRWTNDVPWEKGVLDPSDNSCALTDALPAESTMNAEQRVLNLERKRTEKATHVAGHNELSDEDRARGKHRSAWLDEKLEHHPDGVWSDVDLGKNKGPTYNTIVRYRSGKVSTREAYVRGRIAVALKCCIEEVPL